MLERPMIHKQTHAPLNPAKIFIVRDKKIERKTNICHQIRIILIVIIKYGVEERQAKGAKKYKDS